MELRTAVLLPVIMLAASAQDSQSPLAPPTVGVYILVYHESNTSDPPGVFMPIASYLPDGWTKAELYEMGYACGNQHKELSYTQEQDAYLDMLLKETFYSCTDTSTNFRPKSKTQGGLICSAYLGLEGVYTSTLPENKDTDGFRSRVVSLVNDRTLCGNMAPATINQSTLKQIEAHVLNLLVARVEEYEERFQKEAASRPKVDKMLYKTPVFVEITECSLATGWKALWVHVTVEYPADAGPRVGPFETMPWNGYYYGLLNMDSNKDPWILWEYAEVDQYSGYSSKYQLRLMGVCDIDKDGVPEFVLRKTAHEYCDYQLSRIEKGQIVPIVQLSGAL